MNKRLEIESATLDDVERRFRAVASADLKELKSLVGRMERVAQAMSGILTASEVGDLLRVSEKTVKTTYVEKGLQVYRPGKYLLFLIEDVRTFGRAHPDSALTR